MAFKGQGFETQQVITMAAPSDFSAYQGHAVALAAGGDIALAGAGTGIGILLNKPDADGKLAAVCVHGKVDAYVDGTVAIVAGDPLKSDASGHLVKAATAHDHAIGFALEAKASGTGLIKILVHNFTV